MTTSTEIHEEVVEDKVEGQVEDKVQIYYSPEEYLKLEEGAEFRSEYQDGKIIPMTANLRAIGNRVYTNKVRLRGLGEQVESRKHYEI